MVLNESPFDYKMNCRFEFLKRFIVKALENWAFSNSWQKQVFTIDTKKEDTPFWQSFVNSNFSPDHRLRLAIFFRKPFRKRYSPIKDLSFDTKHDYFRTILKMNF